MSQLDSLLKLEENYNLMDKLNKQLVELEQGKDIKVDEARYNQLSNKLIKMEEALNLGKTKLKQSDYVLKEYELKIKDLDDELYSGSITNEKQLTHLSSERDHIRKSLEELETEILLNMDKISSIEDEIDIIKNKILEFKKQLDLKKKQISENIKKLEKAKIQLQENITKLSTGIEDNLMKEYIKIRADKGSAIALVQGGICSGCHIMVPNYQIEDAKKNEKIVRCESCNRILYAPKISIEK